MGLTSEQRHEFEHRGWFHLESPFSDTDLAEVQGEYDRILANPLRIGEEGKRPFEYSPLLHLPELPLAQQ